MYINSESDENLIGKYASSGDKEIIGQLYLKYSPLVLGTCIKYLKEREQARDLTMTIFEKLLDKLLVNKPNNFKTWLYVLTKNECLMILRKKKPETTDIDSFVMENSMSVHPTIEIDNSDKNEPLKECMEKLKDIQKNCIKAFYLEEKSYKTVSNELDLDIKKVKSNIQNGKRNLQMCIEKSLTHSQTNE